MAGVVGSFTLTGDGERLARVSAVQHIDPWGVGSELAHVGVHRHSGPVALEHGSAVLVVLAEPGGRDADAEVEPSDPGEEAARIHAPTLWQWGADANSDSLSFVMRTT